MTLPVIGAGMESNARFPSLSSADRATLERMARRENDAGTRARIALGAAAGFSIARIAREARTSRVTAKKWAERFLRDGMKGLAPKPRRRGLGADGATVPDFPAGAPPKILCGRGGSASTRVRIECAVRDAAALGRILPGEELPGRAWFARRFRASPATVHAAFANLRGQGFVEASERGRTTLAARLPFDNRFLMILEERNEDGTSGLCDNLERAAALAAAARPGAVWKTVYRESVEPREIARSLAEQRWCGAFLRFAHASGPMWTAPGPAEIASVPRVPMAVGLLFRNVEVSPLVRVMPFDRMESTDDVMALCRRRGWRRVMLADMYRKDRDHEADARAAAAAAGVAIPQSGYVSPSPRDRAADLPRLFGFQTRLVSPRDVDAILVRRDDLLKPLADALRANWGSAAAAHVPVVCWSVGSFLPTEGLAVEWRGPDLVATLLSFMDWCADIRAGVPNPREPRVVQSR